MVSQLGAWKFSFCLLIAFCSSKCLCEEIVLIAQNFQFSCSNVLEFWFWLFTGVNYFFPLTYLQPAAGFGSQSSWNYDNMLSLDSRPIDKQFQKLSFSTYSYSIHLDFLRFTLDLLVRANLCYEWLLLGFGHSGR